jgi:integrase
MSATTPSTVRRTHGAGTIEARGTRRWVVRVSFGRDPLTGHRVREAVTVTGTRRDAERVLRRLLVGKEGGQGPRQARSRLTVGAWMDEFVRTDPEASAPTRRRMQQSWRLYASARLRACLVRDLSPALLTDELARLREHVSPRTKQPLAGRTVGIFYAILRAGLTHAVQLGIIAVNPARALRRPTDETKSPQAPHLSHDEVGTFLTATANDPLATYWRVLAEAGLRPAEGLALRWDDVDLEGATVTVRAALVKDADGTWILAPTKTHQTRRIAVSVATAEALRRHRTRQLEERLRQGERYTDRGLVFADAIGRTLSPFSLSKRFKDLALGAGLRADVRLYSLRHSAATHALQDGLDVRTVAEKLGHATPMLTLQTYAHAMPLERQRESTERLAARYAKGAASQQK